MADLDEKDRSRDRERSRRDRPSRFSEPSRDRSGDRGKERGGMKSSNCRVYVSNIPYEYRWQDLKDLFRSQVGEVAFVELFVDENDKPRGCGIVEFSDPNSVKKCLEVMHRFELKGRKIVIKEDFGNARDKFGNLVGVGQKRNNRDRDDSRGEVRFRDDRRGFDGGPRNQDGDNKWGNTFGLSLQFLESLGIHSPLTNRIFVANLEYTIEKKKLKEVFRLAGKVVWIDMPLDKEGRCRGFAVVEYEHPVESVQAISMFHNQQLFERPMTVRMDRIPEREKLPEGLKSIGMGLGVNGEALKDVAHNLPSGSGNCNTNSTSNTGPGILGAVPSLMGINTAAALSNLNSVNSALGNLNTTSAVLQAANLANLPNNLANLPSNLLASSLSSGDLSLAANLVNNPLVQNQSLASLASSSNMNNAGSNFNRSDNSYMGGQNSNFQNNSGGGGDGGNFGGGRNFQSNYDTSKGGGNFGFGGGDRDGRSNYNSGNNNNNNSGGGGGGGTGNQLIRSTAGGNKTSGFSNKILISNLPPTASYQMLRDKCLEFGEVQRVDDKGNGSVLVSFANEWDAESAIKNMDRARIDGRTIVVRFYY